MNIIVNDACVPPVATAPRTHTVRTRMHAVPRLCCYYLFVRATWCGACCCVLYCRVLYILFVSAMLVSVLYGSRILEIDASAVQHSIVISPRGRMYRTLSLIVLTSMELSQRLRTRF